MMIPHSHDPFSPPLRDGSLLHRQNRPVEDGHFDTAEDITPRPKIGLFELTQAMVYPDGTDSTRPDVPYTEDAKLVWLNHGDDQYGGTTNSPDVTLYYPIALRDGSGIPTGTPPLHTGMRCYAWHNAQSARWEILTPPLNIVRIELTATLMPGSTSVTATLIDSTDDPEITVNVNSPQWPGVGRAGSSTYSHAGTLGYAIWSPARSRWELLCLHAKLIAEGKTDAAINAGASGTVSIWWKDYSTGNLVDSGQNVTALNWFGPNLAASAKVIISFDRQEDRWVIIGT